MANPAQVVIIIQHSRSWNRKIINWKRACARKLACATWWDPASKRGEETKLKNKQAKSAKFISLSRHFFFFWRLLCYTRFRLSLHEFFFWSIFCMQVSAMNLDCWEQGMCKFFYLLLSLRKISNVRKKDVYLTPLNSQRTFVHGKHSINSFGENNCIV